MGLFNLVENFFFISLGITFVLIMLLIFHFKQRLSALESKNEDLVNNLRYLLEYISPKNIINNISNGYIGSKADTSSISCSNDNTSLQNSIISMSMNNTQSYLANNENISSFPSTVPSSLSNNGTFPIPKSVPEWNGNKNPSMKVIVSDDEYDSDTKTEDEYDTDEESNEDLNDLDSDDEYSDDEDDEDEDDEDGNRITTDAILDATEIPNDMIDLLLEEESLDHNLLENVELSTYEEKFESVSMDKKEYLEENESKPMNNCTPEGGDYNSHGQYVENKSFSVENNQNGVVEQNINGSESIHQNTDSFIQTYKKMNVNELKAAIISKGLNVDTSKMKKAELIHLLTSHS